MYLKSLEMQGFKSFPDKISLKFGRGVTAVVGPNGSGKSNIADAVCWVLGEQSTRSLRGNKMEDVIFSGTKDRKAQGFAEVTLRLDNSDSYLNSPEKEIAVTRRFYRSGESAYLINSKNCRLKDVNELFMDTGLGRGGYYMVGQGRIEEMISQKSENRRDMLEEAAGISAFRSRRNDAVKRLERAEENLVRLRDIVSELYSRVGPLEKQSEKAKLFLSFSNERKKLETSLWVNTLERSAHLLREQSNKIYAAQTQYNAAGETLEKLSTEIDSAAQGTRKINARLEEIRTNREKLEERAAALENQISVFENTIAHNAETAERIKKDIEAHSDSGIDIDRETALIDKDLLELNARIENENKILGELSLKLSGFKKTDEEYSEEYNGINSALSETALKLSSAEVAISAASFSLSEIKERINSLDEANVEKTRAGSELKREAAEKEAELKRIDEECEVLYNMRTGYELKLKLAEKKAESLKKVSEEKKLLLLSKQSRLNFLKDTEKNMEGYRGSVKAALRESLKGTLTGIRGTLVNLIKVKEEYQTAIETALGNAVQDIVTETDLDAEKAISMLKQTSAGRATFLPLNAIKGKTLEEKGLENYAGFVELAYKLVECESEYEDIIKFLLGRTAVCDRLETGVALAKKYSYRFRIVTLDGQVINAGGSMTGGSKISNSGFLARRTETERTETECKTLAADVSDTLAALKEAAENILEKKAELESCGKDFTNKNEEKIRVKSELELVVSKLSELENALASSKEEKKSLEKRTLELLAKVGKAKKAKAEASTEKERKEKELLRLSGGRDMLIKKRESVSEEIAEVNMRIISAVKESEAKKDALDSLKKRKENLSAKKEGLNKEIELLAEKNESLKKDIENNRAAAALLKDKELLEHSEAKELIEKREGLEKSVTEARIEEKTKNEEREKIGGELIRLRDKRDYLEKERNDIEKKLFDEYSLTLREAMESAERIESVSKAQKRLSELKREIKELGSVNVAAIDEYKEVSSRYDFLSSQVNDAEKSKKELLRIIEELTLKMSERFKEKFNAINERFKKTFTQLFSGGFAELAPEDEKDILECNIEIKAQPPGKNVKSLSLLSGGEKGLTAIALLFAILKIRPAPFCVFDEVEAGLDDVNALRYAKYMRLMAENTQFILITHARGSMEEADMLYGVTMQERGVSKLLELNSAELAKKFKLE